ncbi:UNVERIFIED_CONTAM: hypothetical protein Sradi_4909200 [Sesamum radiatum]|uniref:Uncharacterized protein n=1 Tax=Sesamum radiatum TaxID=300843 RepID=A0AAW2MCU2_SESRA
MPLRIMVRGLLLLDRLGRRGFECFKGKETDLSVAGSHPRRSSQEDKGELVGYFSYRVL